MSFLFHEGLHILSSVIIGVIAGIITKEWSLALITSLIAGVLVDIDHLFDYWLAFGSTFNLKYFLKGYQFLKSDKIYIPLHGFEYSVLLFFIGYMLKNDYISLIFTPASISLFFHLLIDIATNEMRPNGYFILYRLMKRFELKQIVTVAHYKIHLEQKVKLLNI